MSAMEYANIAAEYAQAKLTGRTLVGYASVFNYPIQTGAHQTTYVRPGAFKRTLAEHPMPQVLLNHGQDPTVGSKPLGVPSVMKTDQTGLYVEVPLDDTSYNRDIVVSLGSGALRAMSIMFETEAESFSTDHSERNIEQVRLHEFGPVTFPANEAAIASLHSLTDYAPVSVEGRRDPYHQKWVDSLVTRMTAEDEELAELAARLQAWKG